MPGPLRTAFIVALSGVAVILLELLYEQLHNHLRLKYNFVLRPDRIDRLIRSSKRWVRKLNQSEDLDAMSHFFTLVDGNEKEVIEEYCTNENMSVDEFLAGLAVDDAKSWKTMKDELWLALGPQPASVKPPKTTDEHLRWFRQLRRVEAIFFRLPAAEYDKVIRHLEKGRLSPRYLGRLAVATINQRQAAVDELGSSLSQPNDAKSHRE